MSLGHRFYSKKPPYHVDFFGRKYRRWWGYRWFTIEGWIRSLILGLLLIGYLIIAERIPLWLTIYLAVINTATFFVYGYDKSLARRQKYRISEVALYGWSMAGGSLGAMLGQLVFRHKIYKAGFQLVLVAILLAQIFFMLWWFE